MSRIPVPSSHSPSANKALHHDRAPSPVPPAPKHPSSASMSNLSGVSPSVADTRRKQSKRDEVSILSAFRLPDAWFCFRYASRTRVHTPSMSSLSPLYQGRAHSASNTISHRRTPVRAVSVANPPSQAIRKKIESELARKRTISTTHHAGGRGKRVAKPAVAKGTVAALKPSPALTVPDNITVAEASQLCAAKRTDCVLVVDDEEGLSGIFTAKDLAYRVRRWLFST
jgi:CBS domain-containing protein